MGDDELKEIVRQIVREELAGFLGSSQFQFQKDAKFYDGRNIQVGYATGTMIGTDPNQKLGFFGGAPVTKSSAGTTAASIAAYLQYLGLSA